MPDIVDDIEILKKYIIGVMYRAEHHAPNVGAIPLALAGAIIWKKDSDPIEVRTHDGEMKNVLWVTISKNRYAFAFNHHTGEIEMRKGSTRGKALHRFSDAMSIIDLKSIFDKL